MDLHVFLILADVDLQSIIQILVVFAFIVFPFLVRIWNAVSTGNRPAPPRPEVVANADKQSKEFQIEDFFRRATGQLQDSSVRRPPEPEIQCAEPVQYGPVEAEIVDEVGLRENVSTHVEHDIQTRNTVERSERLGQRVELAGESLEHHVHEQFDHELRHLHLSSIAEDFGTDKDSDLTHYESDDVDHFEQADPGEQMSKTVALGDVTAMLRNTSNLRSAILLNEILKPASSRW